MSKAWSKFESGNIGNVPRVELKDALGLTGCEVSINKMDAGTATPFVHHHQQNEETYLVLSGSGEFWLDGETIAVKEGSSVRIAPETKRSIKAGPNAPLTYICIQAASGSLKNYSRTDGVLDNGVTAW